MAIDRWKIEVIKMAVYVFIPIFTFAYYSNPVNYEKSVIKAYQEEWPPTDFEEIDQWERAKEKFRQKELATFKSEYVEKK